MANDKPVRLYCDPGTPLAQAGFALVVAGYETVRVLRGGRAGRAVKCGLAAGAKGTGAAKR